MGTGKVAVANAVHLSLIQVSLFTIKRFIYNVNVGRSKEMTFLELKFIRFILLQGLISLIRLTPKRKPQKEFFNYSSFCLPVNTNFNALQKFLLLLLHRTSCVQTQRRNS